MAVWRIEFVFILLLVLASASPLINGHDGARNSTARNEATTISAQTTTVEPILSYKELLNKIEDRCILNHDYEEAYGRKSKAGVVKLFFQLLIQQAFDQIGVDELRKVLHLKEQKVNLTGQIEEQFEEGLNETLDSTQLVVFQQKIRNLQQTYWAQQMFTDSEVSDAVAFIEHKFPEVRKAFRSKFEEESQKFGGKFDNYALLDLFRVFVNSRIDIGSALKKADYASTSGDILPGGPQCVENFEKEKNN